MSMDKGNRVICSMVMFVWALNALFEIYDYQDGLQDAFSTVALITVTLIFNLSLCVLLHMGSKRGI